MRVGAFFFSFFALRLTRGRDEAGGRLQLRGLVRVRVRVGVWVGVGVRREGGSSCETLLGFGLGLGLGLGMGGLGLGLGLGMCGHLVEQAEGLRGRTLRHEQRVDAQRLVGLGFGLGAG